MQRRLAKIDDTMLGYEDHGIVTFALFVDYEDGGYQGIGTYCISDPDVDPDRKRATIQRGTAYGMEMIIRILDAVGVRTWEELKGKYIWVLVNEKFGLGSDPVAILGIQGTFNNKKQIIFDDIRKEYFAS